MQVRSHRSRVEPRLVSDLMNLDSNLNSDTSSLSDLGQVTSLFWASVSSFVKQSSFSGYCIKTYHLFLYFIQQELLSTYHMPDTVLGAKTTMMSQYREVASALCELTVYMGRRSGEGANVVI